jgi:hypothetical protein
VGILGHALIGVEATYDRHSYDDQRERALVALAAVIERIINPPDSKNVVKLRRQ